MADHNQSDSNEKKAVKTKAQEREERLAAKLRENLRRRKEQTRERKA